MNDTTDSIIIEPPGRHTASIIWLHGLGADGHDFEPIVPELGLPAMHGIRFVFPNAPLQPVTINGGMVMRAWYDVRSIDLTREEDEAGIRRATALLETWITAQTAAGIPASRILLAGFSQGGAIALFCGLRHPQRLAGILALSTYLPLPQTLAQEGSEANRHTPILMGHGTADPVIPVQHGRNTAARLEAWGNPVSWHEYPLQHGVSIEEIRDIGTWLVARLPV